MTECTTACIVRVLGEHPEIDKVEIVLSETDDELRIGRNPQKGTQILVIPYGQVSTNHAEIRWSDSSWVITDLGSTNGTTINGTKISAIRDHKLSDGDIVAVAGYRLEIELPGKPLDPLEASPRKSGKQDQSRTMQEQVSKVNVGDVTLLIADIRVAAGIVEDAADMKARLRRPIREWMRTVTDNGGTVDSIEITRLLAYWTSDVVYDHKRPAAAQACMVALQLNAWSEVVEASDSVYELVLDVRLSSFNSSFQREAGSYTSSPELLLDSRDYVYKIRRDKDSVGCVVVDDLTRELAGRHFTFKQIDVEVEGVARPSTVFKLIEPPAEDQMGS